MESHGDTERTEKNPPTIVSDVFAVTLRPVHGRVCRLERGELVKVDWDDGITCAIQRNEWRSPHLPIFNCLAGVPRYFLRFAKLAASSVTPSEKISGA